MLAEAHDTTLNDASVANCSSQLEKNLRRVLMTNRRTLSFSIFAAAILALCLPALAAAQGLRLS